MSVLRFRLDSNYVLPPLRLRTGMTLYHGKWDNPLGMLREVYVDDWYRIDGQRSVSEGMMLDIGANIGAVSLYWAARVPGLTIHANEPNPAAFATLKENIEKNMLQDRITAFPEAVGASEGQLELWVDVRTDLSTAYGVEPPIAGGRRIRVPMIGLKQIWERIGYRNISILKIDVEGGEADILEKKTASTLQATESVIIEYHDNLCPGASARCRSRPRRGTDSRSTSVCILGTRQFSTAIAKTLLHQTRPRNPRDDSRRLSVAALWFSQAAHVTRAAWRVFRVSAASSLRTLGAPGRRPR